MLATGFLCLVALNTLATVASDDHAPSSNRTLPPRDTLPTTVDVLDERGWEDVTFGLMLERDPDPNDTRFTRRAHRQTRDILGSQQTVPLRINKRGDVYVTPLAYDCSPQQGNTKPCLATSLDHQPAHGTEKYHEIGDSSSGTPYEHFHARRSSHRRPSTKSAHNRGKDHTKAGRVKSQKVSEKSKDMISTESNTLGINGNSLLDTTIDTVGDTFEARITWYTGHDLLYPSCVTHSNWNPSDKSMIAAVTIDWPGKPSCGQFLRLRPKNGNKAIIVRVVDSCGGCAAGTAHVDLTIAAFSQLYNLDIGLVNGIQVQRIDDPVKFYDAEAIAMFGPQEL